MKKLMLIILAFSFNLWSADHEARLNINLVHLQKNKEKEKVHIKILLNVTVRALQEFIQGHWKINLDHQQLILSGNDIHNQILSNRFAKLLDYGVKDGSTIYVNSENKPINESESDVDFILNIRQANKIHFRLYINFETTVGDLKKILLSEKVPMGYTVPITLMTAGKILNDDNQKIKDAGIVDGSEIYVTPKRPR